MARTRAGTYATFERRYAPVALPDGSDLRELDDGAIATADIRLVWTVLEVDGKQYVVPGKHFVNRMGYVLASKPWPDEEEAAPGYRY